MDERIRARLFVEADLAAGAELALPREQAHYLAHVLRLGPGAAVALFNGRDGEWRAGVGGLGKSRAVLRVETRLREQAAETDLWLVFAPVKKTPLDFMIQKAVELGAGALLPVITRHTAVERVRRERLRANAIEAAEQCERLTVPRVDEPVSLSHLLDQWPAGRRLLLCAEAGEAAPIQEILGDSDPGGAWAVLTGPEGGFAETELDAMRKLPFVTAVSLGPRVLRADTAALAALACWQANLGDWRQRPPRRA